MTAVSALRKADGRMIQTLANLVNTTHAGWLGMEAGKDTSALTALKVASVLGYRLEDILNLHHDSLSRLLDQRRPLFRLPHTITQPEIVAKVEELNNPKLLREDYYSIGDFDVRCRLLIAITRKLAEKEAGTVEYKAFGRTEYIVPQPAEDGSLASWDYDLPDGLKLGAAYSAVCQRLGLTNKMLSDKTGLSRNYFADLQSDAAESSIGNLDLAAWAVGLSADEVIMIAHPSRRKWPFFIPYGSYSNQDMVKLLTSPATLAAFEQAPVEERASMMLDYRAWLVEEAEARETNNQKHITIPVAFRLIGWSAA